MQKITTFLMFSDRAKEAVNFYVSVFKNSKIESMTRIEGAPGVDDALQLTTFQLEGQEFMAMNGGPHFTFEQGISLFVNCETQEEVDELWEKLAEGGEKQPCGWVRDKFGVSWQIVPSALGEMMQDKDPAKSKRVMEALLKMSKIDIKTLNQAYEQE